MSLKTKIRPPKISAVEPHLRTVPFGWQGIAFDAHPDWSPVTLSGDRHSGYVRLASGSSLQIQLRWTKSKRAADSEAFLASYRRLLERDVRKAKLHLTFESSGERFRWSADRHACGALLRLDGRTVVLEASAASKQDASQAMERLIPTLRGDVDGREIWALFGLSLKAPSGARSKTVRLHAGATQFELWWLNRLGRPVATLGARRLAMADAILNAHGGFEAWCAQATGGFPIDEVRAEAVARGAFGMHRWSLVRHDADLDQLISISVRSRSQRWRPTWDWLI
jgi:hypothetical protein